MFEYCIALLIIIYCCIKYYYCNSFCASSSTSIPSTSQDELTEKSVLALKKDELDAAAIQWKSRVEKSDAEKFSVAGRMEDKQDAKTVTLSLNISADKNKRMPQAKRFKGKDGMCNIIIVSAFSSRFDGDR